MSAGRVALPTKGRQPFDHGLQSVPASSENDAKVHAKYRTILLLRIGMRAGDNTDIMEALGLIPTIQNPAPATPGRWPRGLEV